MAGGSLHSGFHVVQLRTSRVETNIDYLCTDQFFTKKAIHSSYSNITRILKTFSEFFSHTTDWKIINQEF